MNRGIALFVGLAALFAHILAIYSDGSGSLPPVCDRAYAAFRVARNLVHEGALRWNPTEPVFESYPSFLWTLWIAVAERLQLSPNTWAQWTGIASALATVALAARFHVDRIASLMGPMLLVVSGGLAASAACGTETALLALLVIASFLAYERAWTGRLALLLVLLCLTRPEGAWIAGGLAALRLVGGKGTGSDAPRPGWIAFLPPVLALGALALVRHSTSGELLSPTTMGLVSPAPGQWSEGLRYVRDFVVSSVTPIALVFPLGYLVRGKLSSSGRHALFLTAVWTAGVLLTGGDSLPFYEAMVPALPLLCHAVQEGLTVTLDSDHWYLRRPGVLVFVLALFFSGIASTFPVDRGPIPTEALQLAWMRPTTSARPCFEESLGRTGLAEEIRMTERARGIGLFMRDSLEPGATILTPWPGAIGYLSRLRVLDLLGRVTPTPGTSRGAPWSYPGRTGVRAWLATEPDYIVPTLYLLDRPPTRETIVAMWGEALDAADEGDGRRTAVEEDLAAYEVVSIPMTLSVPGTADERTWPFYLLRRRGLGLRPTLDIEVHGDEVRINAHNRHGHRQMANLRVWLETADGHTWSMRPTGRFTDKVSTFARTNLLIYPTGGRSIALASFALHELDGSRPIRVSAVLVNPGSRDDRDFWGVSGEVVVDL